MWASTSKDWSGGDKHGDLRKVGAEYLGGVTVRVEPDRLGVLLTIGQAVQRAQHAIEAPGP